MALANGSSAGGGLFGCGSDPELALAEVSRTEVLLLAPSVTAGAARASDPVRSRRLVSGHPAVASHACPFSTLLGASPERRGWGRWGEAVAARGAPCVF